MIITGPRLRQLREKRGISLRSAARIGGIDPGTLSLVERGLANPSLPVLTAIAGVLGCDVVLRPRKAG